MYYDSCKIYIGIRVYRSFALSMVDDHCKIDVKPGYRLNEIFNIKKFIENPDRYNLSFNRVSLQLEVLNMRRYFFGSKKLRYKKFSNANFGSNCKFLINILYFIYYHVNKLVSVFKTNSNIFKNLNFSLLSIFSTIAR